MVPYILVLCASFRESSVWRSLFVDFLLVLQQFATVVAVHMEKRLLPFHMVTGGPLIFFRLLGLQQFATVVAVHMEEEKSKINQP